MIEGPSHEAIELVEVRRKRGFQVRLVILLSVAAALMSPISVSAAPADAARAYVAAHRKEIVEEYLKLVSVPDLHGDVPNLKRNADLLLAMMKQRGLDAELWDTSGGVPVVFGQKLVPGAKHTILFYAHMTASRWIPSVGNSPIPSSRCSAPTASKRAATGQQTCRQAFPIPGGFTPGRRATIKCRRGHPQGAGPGSAQGEYQSLSAW